MTQAQQKRLMNRVMGSTPYGGANQLLQLLGEAVRMHHPNPEAAEHPTYCARTLDDLALLCKGAAALLRDPDFLAQNWDVFDDKQWDEQGYYRLSSAQ
jgi:hypothetical protein